jgi:hypothetical protein
VFDILALSPFNIIFGASEIEDPLWLLTPLRLLRILTVARIPALLERIEINFIKVSGYIQMIKTILFLVYLWHWSSCLWFFVNLKVEHEDDYKWLNYN